MTIDEMVAEFAKENEPLLRQFAHERPYESISKNQGIAQSIDKSFSKVETEHNLTKN